MARRPPADRSPAGVVPERCLDLERDACQHDVGRASPRAAFESYGVRVTLYAPPLACRWPARAPARQASRVCGVHRRASAKSATPLSRRGIRSRPFGAAQSRAFATLSDGTTHAPPTGRVGSVGRCQEEWTLRNGRSEMWALILAGIVALVACVAAFMRGASEVSGGERDGILDLRPDDHGRQQRDAA